MPGFDETSAIRSIAPLPGKGKAPSRPAAEGNPDAAALLPPPAAPAGKKPHPLWAAVHFPDLAAEIFDAGGRPLAVHREGGRQRRIEAVNAAARVLGIRPGLAPSAGCALAPGLCLRTRDQAEEQRRLQRLARRLGRFSSRVALFPGNTVLAEIGGSLRLFGGLEPLLSRLRWEMAGAQHRFLLAAAPTPPAAALLARCGREEVIADPSRLVSAVGGLSIEALEIDPRDLATLHGMGIGRVADLLRLPRDGLARRTNPGLLTLLDELVGRRPAPVPPFLPPFRFRAEEELEAAGGNMEALIPLLHRLLERMHGALARRCLAIRGFRVELLHPDGRRTPVRVSLGRPGRDLERWKRLLALRLERLRLSAPVGRIVLRADHAMAWGGAPRTLLPGDPAGGRVRREELLELLRNRLGDGAVHGLAPAPRHLPEQAWRRVPPGRAAVESVAPGARPLWLLPAPHPLSGAAITLAGNERERVCGGWWEGTQQDRDYFTAVSREGEPLWVFRDRRSRKWFLHGYW